MQQFWGLRVLRVKYREYIRILLPRKLVPLRYSIEDEYIAAFIQSRVCAYCLIYVFPSLFRKVFAKSYPTDFSHTVGRISRN